MFGMAASLQELQAPVSRVLVAAAGPGFTGAGEGGIADHAIRAVERRRELGSRELRHGISARSSRAKA
jgi:hypothetical protein